VVIRRCFCRHKGQPQTYRAIYDAAHYAGFFAGSGERGYQADVRSLMKRMHAVAVVLDLVQPAVPRRRLVYQARELRLDPFRRPSCRSHAANGVHLAGQGTRCNSARCLRIHAVPRH